mmetsp:Transcript_38682/g.111738  ORF Transcript_38682/g.111738 Transcript_38682/m.111738 type:complete len:245 (-) Transcript_38682:129-863(-)
MPFAGVEPSSGSHLKWCCVRAGHHTPPLTSSHSGAWQSLCSPVPRCSRTRRHRRSSRGSSSGVCPPRPSPHPSSPASRGAGSMWTPAWSLRPTRGRAWSWSGASWRPRSKSPPATSPAYARIARPRGRSGRRPSWISRMWPPASRTSMARGIFRSAGPRAGATSQAAAQVGTEPGWRRAPRSCRPSAPSPSCPGHLLNQAAVTRAAEGRRRPSSPPLQAATRTTLDRGPRPQDPAGAIGPPSKA